MRWFLVMAMAATAAFGGKPRSGSCKEKCALYIPMCQGQCKELGGKHVKECNQQCTKVVGICESDCEKKQSRKH